MFRKLMALQIQLRFEDVSLVRLTFSIQTDEVHSRKVFFELLVVQVILRVSASISPVAYVASLMFLAAMGVKFIIPVESLLAKAALGVSFEARLVDCAGIVVSKLFMLS